MESPSEGSGGNSPFDENERNSPSEGSGGNSPISFEKKPKFLEGFSFLENRVSEQEHHVVKLQKTESVGQRTDFSPSFFNNTVKSIGNFKETLTSAENTFLHKMDLEYIDEKNDNKIKKWDKFIGKK